MSAALALTLSALTATSAAAAGPAVGGAWTPLAPGLEWGRIPPRPGSRDVGDLEIVRAGPAAVVLDVAHGEPRAAGAWADAQARGGVLVVTNAGMFEEDHRTHTGYLAVGGKALNPRWNKYQSLLAFDPKDPALPAFRLLERDVPADRDRVTDYRGCLQNLRLIAAPGVNKWTRQGRAWSEAALAVDGRGRLLVVFAREAHEMIDFADRLIAQLGVVSAQHLEGGPEASLSIRAPGLQVDRAGSYETGFFDDRNREQWPLPNVLVLRTR